jgi:4-hydroxy-tetrahydrodipicolinate synthase
MLEKPLRGIIPPAITPMKDDGTLDINGLEKLLNRMVQGGVSGVFILGTTGEAQNLSYNVRKELIEQTCKIINGRIPVLAGITDTSFSESLSLAGMAAGQGVDALVSAPPYYYTPGQPELIQYYRHLADKLPLPLFLYNMPSHVKVMIQPATVHTLSEHPNIIGLKDSSANSVYFQELLYLLRDKPDFSLLVGPEEITAEAVLMGAHGGVNGGANMFPELYVAIYHAAVNKDYAKIAALQAKIMQISTSLYRVGKHGSSYLKGVKTTLSLLGVCNDFMAEPFHRFESKEREIIKNSLIDLGIIEV